MRRRISIPAVRKSYIVYVVQRFLEIFSKPTITFFEVLTFFEFRIARDNSRLNFELAFGTNNKKTPILCYKLFDVHRLRRQLEVDVSAIESSLNDYVEIYIATIFAWKWRTCVKNLNKYRGKFTGKRC